MDTDKLFTAAQETSADKRKNNQYLEMWIPCCFTCKHSYQEPEDELRCGLLSDSEWVVDGVYELGFCNKYETVIQNG